MAQETNATVTSASFDARLAAGQTHGEEPVPGSFLPAVSSPPGFNAAQLMEQMAALQAEVNKDKAENDKWRFLCSTVTDDLAAGAAPKVEKVAVGRPGAQQEDYMPP